MSKLKVLKSPAKINIGLWITGKRPDGYHEIFTIFHTIDLYDRIFIKPYHRLKVDTTNPSINPDENIIYKTAKLFEEWTGISPTGEILIEKNIPIGSGLGGGSSNAAVMLKYFNEFYKKPLSEKDLFKLAAHIGADVPFFLKGGMAIGEGTGDKLLFLSKKFNKKVIIIFPNISISTKEIYSRVSLKMLTSKEDIHIIDSLLDDFDKLVKNVENTLGKIVEELYPEVKEVLNTMRHLKYTPLVSGSGSSVFAPGKPTEELKKICQIKGWRLIEATLI